MEKWGRLNENSLFQVGTLPLGPYMLQKKVNFCYTESLNAPWTVSSSSHTSAVTLSAYNWWCYYRVWQAKICVGTMLLCHGLLTQLKLIGATNPEGLNFFTAAATCIWWFSQGFTFGEQMSEYTVSSWMWVGGGRTTMILLVGKNSGTSVRVCTNFIIVFT